MKHGRMFSPYKANNSPTLSWFIFDSRFSFCFYISQFSRKKTTFCDFNEFLLHGNRGDSSAKRHRINYCFGKVFIFLVKNTFSIANSFFLINLMINELILTKHIFLQSLILGTKIKFQKFEFFKESNTIWNIDLIDF